MLRSRAALADRKRPDGRRRGSQKLARGEVTIAVAQTSWSTRALAHLRGRVGPGSTSKVDTVHEPLLWAATAFALGLWIGRYAWRPPIWWIVAASFFLFAATWFLQRRPAFSCALTLAALLFTGALAIQTRPGRGGDATSHWLATQEPVLITAHVISEGNIQSAGAGSFREPIDVETETIQSEKAAEPLRIGVRLNVYSKNQELIEESRASSPDATPMPEFRYGQRIRFSGTLNPPRNFRNPGAFDYTGFLRDEGIAATSSAKLDDIETLPGFSGSRARFYLARIRASILTKIHALWPEQAAVLLDAMLIGEKSFIERSTRVDFQRSGTYHMLIVAGLHVGIVAMFTLWLFRRLRLGEFVASGITVVLILIYASLTKEGSPVWRAAVMFSVYLVTRLLYRKRAVLNALGAAALALLIANPNALFGASFQMSFLCVALIAGIAVPFLQETVEPFARGLRNLDSLAWDRSLPPRVAQFRLDLRMILKRAARLEQSSRSRRASAAALHTIFRFAELAVISAVMQLGMALPMAYYFHRATSVATFANLLAVPLLQILMPTAAVAIAVSYVSLWLAKIPAEIAAIALYGIAGTVRWLGGLRIADVRLPTPGLVVVLISAALIPLAIFLVRRRNLFLLAAPALLVLGALCVWERRPAEQIRSGALEMTAIDVGQGDAILLVFPDRRKLLVDSGGLPFWTRSAMDIGEDVVSPYLWSRGISRLDAIALSHAHADHMGGFPAIIANFRPRELWLPEGLANEEIGPLLRAAARFNVKVIHRKAGDTFSYGSAQIRILAPDPDFPVRVAHRNDESLVMKVSYGKTSALLEADAEKGTERLVSLEDPQADVLKVAHHGSLTSSEPQLLAAVHPKFAVISVGLRNVYRQPRPEVLARLQRFGIATYRTDIDGASSFFLDGAQVTAVSPDLR